MNLTEEQRLVAEHDEGPAGVIACPGAGKTTTLAERCRMLPRDEHKTILAFNKAAQQAFQKKIKGVPNCKVQTFHAFCLGQVLKNYKQYGFSAKPDLDTDSTFCHLICKANEIEARGWDAANLDEELANYVEISMYDEELRQSIEDIRIDTLLELKDKLLKDARSADTIKALDAQAELCRLENEFLRHRTMKAVLRLREWLLENDVITFNATVRLVAQHRSKLNVWTDHLMVDEFQDVDRFQFDIIKRIWDSGKLISIVVVGDPHQRIYEWRGALEDGFMDFITYFDADTFQLSYNFRSTPEIVDFAEKKICVGMQATRKSIGEKVMEISSESYLETFRKFFHGSPPLNLSQTAVIARYNRTCFLWQLEMARADIPVYMMGVGDFWNQAHIKLIMAGRAEGFDTDALFTCEDWPRLITKRQYANNEERLKEIEADAAWLLKAPESDIVLLKKNLQVPDTGLRISTAHKTKGLEFQNVIVSNVDDKFQSDDFVYYVAITRAQDRLCIHRNPKADFAHRSSTSETKDIDPMELLFPGISKENIPNRS